MVELFAVGCWSIWTDGSPAEWMWLQWRLCAVLSLFWSHSQ